MNHHKQGLTEAADVPQVSIPHPSHVVRRTVRGPDDLDLEGGTIPETDGEGANRVIRQAPLHRREVRQSPPVVRAMIVMVRPVGKGVNPSWA
jgi:hypothetical protein